jgi:hypothetical protein
LGWLADIATDLDFIGGTIAGIGRPAFVAVYGDSFNTLSGPEAMIAGT